MRAWRVEEEEEQQEEEGEQEDEEENEGQEQEQGQDQESEQGSRMVSRRAVIRMSSKSSSSSNFSRSRRNSQHSRSSRSKRVAVAPMAIWTSPHLSARWNSAITVVRSSRPTGLPRWIMCVSKMNPAPDRTGRR